jgi:hypothetical protein
MRDEWCLSAQFTLESTCWSVTPLSQPDDYAADIGQVPDPVPEVSRAEP